MRLLAASLLAGLLLPLTAGAVPALDAGPHPTPAPRAAHVAGPHAHRPFIAYGPHSFLKSRVQGAPVNQKLTREFHRFMATFPGQRGTDFPTIHGIDDNRWGMPFAMSTCSDPRWKIGAASGSTPGRWQKLRSTGFHAPADLGAHLTGTNDSPLVVIDRAGSLAAQPLAERGDLGGARRRLAQPQHQPLDGNEHPASLAPVTTRYRPDPPRRCRRRSGSARSSHRSHHRRRRRQSRHHPCR